ncbi:MAG: hypothetical protein J3R72DRAFT_522052 [Linnemannia gamsii]|nr:MAG: hypothetical protein J3R72DRAFT_522052 [Linnemannia gamsii]
MTFAFSPFLYLLPLSFFSFPHPPLSSFFSTANTFTTLLGGFQSACCDCAIGAVLGLVGGSEDRKHKENEGPAPVFGLGPGSFDTQTGLPSKHPALEKLFIRKAVALGYTVVGVHGFYTSAKCPRPDCDNFLISEKKRSRYCSECKIYMGQDQGGSEPWPASP